MKILLLEDNSTDAELTRRSLTSELPGCKITIAPTLKDARECISKDENFDIALLDMSLPDGNGQELLVEIRESGADMAVVMLTGSGNEEVAVAALKAGADDYVVKHTGYISQLPANINIAIQNYKHNQQLRTGQIKALYIEHHTSDIDLTIRYLKQYAPNILIDPVLSASEALMTLPDSNLMPAKHDVILMDYRLPGLNALEFIKIIRQERKLDIPIILVSGHGSEEIAVQALRLGANEYLVKRENYLSRLPIIILNAHEHHELLKKQFALAESEEKYRYLFANNPQPMWIYDTETLAFLEVNDSAIQHYGYTKEEFLSITIKDIRPKEDIPFLINVVGRLDNVNNSFGEYRHLKKNGEIIIVEVISHALEFNNRKARHVMVNDITKRYLAENELRKLSSAVEQSPVTILITDLNGTIEYVNPSFTEITGYTSAEVIGKNPRILKSGDTSDEAYKILWDTITSGNTWRGEFKNLKKNGEHFFESASISPIKDNNGLITHFLAVKEDITKRKLAEEQISKLNESLEHKVSERTAQLQAANKEMEAFSYSVSHDLRSPLRAIAGFATILTEDYDKIIDAEGKRLLNLITSNAKNMGQLIDDLLAFSRLGRKDINFDIIDMNALVLEAYDTIVAENERPLINISVQNLPAVSGDFSMLKQVWINLISNAIKFTSQKTDRTIEIGCTNEPKSFVFYIKDNGAGFDMSYSAKLFGVFQRLHSAKEFEGTGIGLALVKQIINRHKGQIWAESSPNQGATFFFSLPVEPV